MQSFLPAGAVPVGLILAAAALLMTSDLASGIRSSKDRQPAPDFALTDAQGARVSLSDYKGKVVLLNFWATWCPPCKVEIPWFEEFESKYKGSGFAVLGVSMDDDGWTSVRPFMQQKKINYRIMIGDNATSSKYGGIDSLPETLLIDRDGKIAATHLGLTSKSNYEGEIVELLKK
jgi:cytochrome c biogenesis protein CcmG/thiol:disulfide interchange protein DsbE